LYQEFLASTQLFIRQSVTCPTQQEVVALAAWHAQVWLVDADCDFYDSAPTTIHDLPTSVHVPPNEPTASIVTLRQFSLDATALLTVLTKARPLIRTEVNVKTHDGGQLVSGLGGCSATLDFVSEDFVRRFYLPTRKSKTKTLVRQANGQRVSFSIVSDITFEMARHEFQRTFYVLRDLRVADLVLGLPWLDDEQASLPFGMTRVFTMLDGTTMDTQK
jgi:hypothetical protein